jgi:small subunit ribosomal protein S16
VAVKIKLKRMGKIRAPFYRIIVADARTKRDGRAIEEIGKYHPKEEPSLIEVKSERAQYWLSVGAQPTDPVRKLLEITGDWQKFRGQPGAEGTLKAPAPKADKKEAFAAALAETLRAGEAEGKGKSRKAPAKTEGKAEGKAAKTEGKADGKAARADAGKAGAAKAGDAKAGAGREGKAAKSGSGGAASKARGDGDTAGAEETGAAAGVTETAEATERATERESGA